MIDVKRRIRKYYQQSMTPSDALVRELSGGACEHESVCKLCIE